MALDEAHKTIRLLADEHYWKVRIPVQRLQWVRDLDETIEHLVTEGPSPPRNTVFWIRLYGVLEELRRRLREEDASDQRVRLVLQSILDTVAQLSQDELLWLEYRRHTETHVEQAGYRLAQNKDGSLNDTRRFPILEADLPRSQVVTRLREFVETYDFDEGRIAQEMARKVRPFIRLVRLQLLQLYPTIAP